MKITTFDPLITSAKAGEAIKLFEELGFKKTHTPTTALETTDVTSTRMKDENGFHVDIAQWDGLPQDITLIRMNVDNFDEAYEILIKHGFKNNRGDGTINTKSVKAATMISPSGFMISLIEHIKK
jgi:hypothetical protein